MQSWKYYDAHSLGISHNEIKSCVLKKMQSNHFAYTANVYTQTTDLLLFSDVVITHKNV